MIVDEDGILSAIVSGMPFRELRDQILAGLIPPTSGRTEEARRLAAALRQRGAQMTWLGRPEYPESLGRRLGARAPPVMFWVGEASILSRPAIGIVGSRHASAEATELARELAAKANGAGFAVVSGGAAGVDAAAREGALQSGGNVLTVIPEGILKRRRTTDPNHEVVLSFFPPSAGWSAGAAMQRNAWVCGLSTAIVAVEAGEEGGTLACGRTALKLGLPVIVPAPHFLPNRPQGNEILMREGATSAPASVDAIVALLRTSNSAAQTPDGKKGIIKRLNEFGPQ